MVENQDIKFLSKKKKTIKKVLHLGREWTSVNDLSHFVNYQ